MVLSLGEKKQWDCQLDSHLMNTGCANLWDAVMVGFSSYRTATKEEKRTMIDEKQFPNLETPSLSDWINVFRSGLYEASKETDTDSQIFFKLLSIRFLELELLTYLTQNLDENTTPEQFREEVLEKTSLLAEYRLKKKAKGFTLKDVEESIQVVLTKLLKPCFQTILPSDSELKQVAIHLGYHLLLLSPDEAVLYDSFSPEDKFLETIVVLVLPDGFESVGRFTLTKEGHKRLSRLFPYDDPLISKLRRSHLNTKEG